MNIYQFPDIVEYSEKWANAGKTVIVAALDGTFQRKPFGEVLQLLPMSEHVTKLNAVCMVCFKDAPFTRRLGSETKVYNIHNRYKYKYILYRNLMLISSPLLSYHTTTYQPG